MTMKIPLLTHISSWILALSVTVLSGADYTFNLGNGRNVLWNTGGIWTDSEGTPYGSGINPGPGDIILSLDYDEGQGVGIPNLYLNNNRTIARLESSNRSNTRIWSGNFNNPGANAQHTLTITEAFNMKAGVYYLRSMTGGKLTVEMPVLRFGSADYPTLRARVELGSGTTGHGNIVFTSQETWFSGYNPQFSINAAFDTVNGSVHLGHVVFDMTPGVEDNIHSFPGITLGHVNQVLNVASLHGGANETRGAVKGVGTVRIDPGSSSLPLSGPADFNRSIEGDIRIEKRGTSVQTLSYANTYSGGTGIESGVLSVQNNTGSGLGTGPVDVYESGVLSGGGRIALSGTNQVTVYAGGRVSPGEGNRLHVVAGHETMQYETLTLHNTVLSMQEESIFQFRLGDGGESDRIEFTGYTVGMLNLDASGIQVDILGEFHAGNYVLFSFMQDENRVSSGLTGGLFLANEVEGMIATFYYDHPDYGGMGTISLSLSEVPEPMTISLLMGILVLGYCSRISKRSR